MKLALETAETLELYLQTLDHMTDEDAAEATARLDQANDLISEAQAHMQEVRNIAKSTALRVGYGG